MGPPRPAENLSITQMQSIQKGPDCYYFSTFTHSTDTSLLVITNGGSTVMGNAGRVIGSPMPRPSQINETDQVNGKEVNPNAKGASNSANVGVPGVVVADASPKGSAGERILEGQMKKANLDSKLDANANSTAAQQFGKNLAQEAKANPAKAAQIVDEKLKNLPPSMQAEAASEIAKNYTNDELNNLARNKEGREFLDVVENGMLDGNVPDRHQAEINRIREARLSSPGSPEDQANIVLKKAMQPGPLDDKFLGKEIGREIKKDPANGTRMADWVLRHALPADRATIASRFTDNLDKQQLNDLAKTRDGRNLLRLMQKEMTVSNTKLPPAFRIDEALKETAPAFSARRELEKTTDFKNLSETTRKEMLNAAMHKVGDKQFEDALKKLVGNPEFQKLGDAGARVVQDLTKFTTTSSYIGMKDTPSANALDIIGTMSIYTEGGHTNKLPTARNTLDQLLNDRVKMRIVNESGTAIAGEARITSVRFNIGNSQLMDNPENLMTNAAHEVNHVLNGQSQPGVEHFLDEYRAYYMEQTAIGNKNPDAEFMNNKLQEITMDQEPYKDINQLYRSDSKFRDVVEQMYKGLEATKPPKIMSPETLRAKLRALPGGDSSEYLKKTPNMDNH